MDHAATARQLLANRASGAAIGVGVWADSGSAPSSEADGYAVQAAMTAERVAGGATPIGYKIGATNQGARDLLRIATPFYGRLYRETTVEGADEIALNPAYHKVAEPEVALRIAHDLDPDAAPFTAEAIRAATDALMPAIEVIGCCFDPWVEAGSATLIADNGAHGSWIVGAPIADWSGFDPLESLITVTRAKAEPATGKGAAVDGGPFGATAWLANKLAEQGLSLKAGDVVSTGTVTPPIPLAAGDEIVCDYGALGTVRLTLSG